MTISWFQNKCWHFPSRLEGLVCSLKSRTTTAWSWFTGLCEANDRTVPLYSYQFSFRSGLYLCDRSQSQRSRSVLEGLLNSVCHSIALFRRLWKRKVGKRKRKLLWCVFDGVKAARCQLALINESKHQTGCIPQVNPNFDTSTGVISPRCKYLLCNKRGNGTETDNYLLLWHLQNAMSLTMCNWWLFFTGPPGSKMCLSSFLYLFICILFFLFFFFF